jgi:tRNA-splicing ligase RtcB
MIERIETLGNLPVISWCASIEEGARVQLSHLADHPRLFHHIAVMPDCHQGYGMPIGGVIAARDIIIPNAVGVDIGCGMCALRTGIRSYDEARLKRALAGIRVVIPLGFEHHKKDQDERFMPDIAIDGTMMPVVGREYKSALRQIGTLGGGNHFIELQRDRDGVLRVMIHSGSRNLGKQVADRYNAEAVRIDSGRKHPIPHAWQLAFLDDDSVEGRMYISEMEYCVSFARANRLLMMNRIIGVLGEIFPDAAFDTPVDIAHNYASKEDHFGKTVRVHRKGATFAGKGTIGIIPGSQGTNSYIVRGKGNPESFESCSHGAGRRMGRREAERRLDLDAEREALERRCIIHSLCTRTDLDEAAGAYKDIEEVMRAQDDLVEIVTELAPLAVVKG